VEHGSAVCSARIGKEPHTQRQRIASAKPGEDGDDAGLRSLHGEAVIFVLGGHGLTPLKSTELEEEIRQCDFVVVGVTDEPFLERDDMCRGLRVRLNTPRQAGVR
jgi:hypothetical protein